MKLVTYIPYLNKIPVLNTTSVLTKLAEVKYLQHNTSYYENLVNIRSNVKKSNLDFFINISHLIHTNHSPSVSHINSRTLKWIGEYQKDFKPSTRRGVVLPQFDEIDFVYPDEFVYVPSTFLDDSILEGRDIYDVYGKPSSTSGNK